MSISRAEFYTPDPDTTIERLVPLDHVIEPVVSPYSEMGAVLSTTELIEANLPYARAVAMALSGTRVATRHFVSTEITPYTELDDRVQAAFEGLVMAITVYSEHLGSQKEPSTDSFLTLLSQHIDDSMQENASYDHSLEVLGPLIREYRMEKAARRQGSVDTIVARRIEHTIPNCDEWVSANAHVSLDTLVFPEAATEEVWDDDHDEPLSLAAAEVIGDNVDMAEEVANSQVMGSLEQSLNELSGEIRDYARLFYGFNSEGKRYTRKRIREILGLQPDALRAYHRQMLNYIEKQVMPSTASWPPSSKSQVSAGGCLKTGKIIATHRHIATPPDAPKEHDDPSIPLGSEPIKRPEWASEEYMIIRDMFLGHMLQSKHYAKQPLGTPETPYPLALCNELDNTLGQYLTPGHIEEFWNNILPAFLDQLRNELGDNLDIDRIGQAVSRLLSTRMREDDRVTLRLDKEHLFNYLGAWAKQGEILLNGYAGDYTGLHMTGTAKIKVLGDVGKYAGKGARGHAKLIVEGSADTYLGHRAGDKAVIAISGKAKMHAGKSIRGNARVSDRYYMWSVRDHNKIVETSNKP